MRSVLPAFLFLCFFVVGVYISLNSWNSTVYWYPEGSRDPAAISKGLDLSHLEGRALEMASYQRLVTGAELIASEDGFGVQLGHFVTKNDRGYREFACGYYNKVQLVFESANMSVNGDTSKMTIDTTCEPNDDMDHISTIWIPLKNLYSEKTKDFEAKLNQERPIEIIFTNIGDRWPQAWTLTKIKLYSEIYTQRALEVSHSELLEVNKKPITFVWEP